MSRLSSRRTPLERVKMLQFVTVIDVAAENHILYVAPAAGKIRKLHVYVQNADTAPNYWTLKPLKNGSAIGSTTVTTETAGWKTLVAESQVISFAKGDVIAMGTAKGGPAANNKCAVELTVEYSEDITL